VEVSIESDKLAEALDALSASGFPVMSAAPQQSTALVVVAPAPAAPIYRTREEWLQRAVEVLRPIISGKGFTVPDKVRVACGFPSKHATSRKKQRVGECWTAEASADQHHEILVSPVLADECRVLGVLVHELGHAAVGAKCGHRGPFVKYAKAMHLEGKPSATTEGDAFKRYILAEVQARIAAPYPHAELHAKGATKKQGTRMLKVKCHLCGYVCRVTMKWLHDAGAPVCPTDQVPMTAPDNGE
jgi:hypothetical protein